MIQKQYFRLVMYVIYVSFNSDTLCKMSWKIDLQNYKKPLSIIEDHVVIHVHQTLSTQQYETTVVVMV